MVMREGDLEDKGEDQDWLLKIMIGYDCYAVVLLFLVVVIYFCVQENVYSGDDRPPRGGRGSRPFRGGGRGGQRSGKREFERRSGSDKR